MLGTKFLLPLLVVVVGAGVVEGQGQGTFRPFQRLDRWLGLGNGPGYNWQNPGPDSSYYNPWSAHNSSLISAGNPGRTGSYPLNYHGTNQYVPNPIQIQGATRFQSPDNSSVAPGELKRKTEKPVEAENGDGDPASFSPIESSLQTLEREMNVPLGRNQPTPAVRPKQPPLLSGGG